MEVAADGDEYGTDGGNESKVPDCDTNGLELAEFGASSLLRFKRTGLSIDDFEILVHTYNSPLGEIRNSNCTSCFWKHCQSICMNRGKRLAPSAYYLCTRLPRVSLICTLVPGS